MGKEHLIASFQEPYKTNTFKPLHALTLLIIFFMLPAFAMLHTQGFLLWLALVCGYLYLFVGNRYRFRYELTDFEIRRYVPDSYSTPLRIPLQEIISIREYGNHTRVSIPKKTYLIYTGAVNHHFIQLLKEHHTRVTEDKSGS